MAGGIALGRMRQAICQARQSVNQHGKGGSTDVSKGISIGHLRGATIAEVDITRFIFARTGTLIIPPTLIPPPPSTAMSSLSLTSTPQQPPNMSEETHDPLELLRASITSSLPAQLLTAASEPASSLALAAYISFPRTSGEPVNITKDHSTRYTSKAGQSSEFYNIAQLWLAWTERDSGVREYLVKGQAGGVGYVSVADRRGVVEYLQGGDGGGRVVGGELV